MKRHQLAALIEQIKALRAEVGYGVLCFRAGGSEEQMEAFVARLERLVGGIRVSFDRARG